MRNFSFLCHACYRAHLQGPGWCVNTIVVGGFSLPIIARGSSLDLPILGGSSDVVSSSFSLFAFTAGHYLLCIHCRHGNHLSCVHGHLWHYHSCVHCHLWFAFTVGISSCAFTAVCRHGHHLSCVHCHLWHYRSCVHCHLWHYIFRY